MADTKRQSISIDAEASAIKKVSIASNSTGKVAELAGATISLRYSESIFDDTLSVLVSSVDTGNTIAGEDDGSLTTAIDGLPIVGTEKVSIKIEDNLENTIELDLYVNKVNVLSSDTKRNTIAINLVSKEFIFNEKIRVNTRFDGKISDHIKKIIQDNPNYLKTDKEIDIEETDNNYNFIGNNKKPFHLFHVLSKKSVPVGKLGKSAGFFLFETSDGFKFKSIDSLFDKEKNPIKKSILFDDSPDEKGEKLPPQYDVKAMRYFPNNDIDVKSKLLVGAYSTRMISFDPYTFDYKITTRDVFDSSTKSSGKKPEDEGLEDNLTKAAENLPVLNREFTREEDNREYSRTTYYIGDTGSLPSGSGYGKEQEQLKKSADPNFNHTQIVNQSIRRYNQLIASSAIVEIPGDLSLHAGDSVFFDAPAITSDKKGDINKQTGGLYIISDVVHELSSDQTITTLNLVRDSFGRKGTPIKG